MGKVNLYAAGRLSKLPGVSMNPMLYPQSIPVRTRRAVQRMILSGAIDGRWQSVSARLAQTLCNEFSLTHTRSYRTEVLVPSYTPLGTITVKHGTSHYEGFTWHGLRHTWATWHMQNDTPADVVQALGGWADARMVRNYAHHSPSHLARFAGNNRKT